MVYGGDRLFVLAHHVFGRNAYQVIDDAFAEVGSLFVERFHPFLRGLVAFEEGFESRVERFHGKPRHDRRFLIGLRDGDGRRFEETRVEKRRRFFFHALAFGHLFVADEFCGDLYKAAGERQENEGANDVEKGVEHGDLPARVGEPLRERSAHEPRPRQKEYREYHRAEHVEHEVDEARALGVGARADRREDRRDARADVAAQNHRRGEFPG